MNTRIRRIGVQGAICAVLALTVFGGGPKEAAAQIPGLGTLEQQMDRLRDQSMGLLQGCDYLEYLELVDVATEAWSFREELFSGRIKSRGNYGIPTTDYISMIFRGVGAQGAQRAGQAEALNLIYQLEQVCNHAVQLNEMSRMLDIQEARNMRIGDAINWLLDRAEEVLEEEEEEGPRRRLDEEFGSLYAVASPLPSSPQDELWTSVTGVLESTITASAEYAGVTARIREQIEELKKQLVHLAEWGEDEDGEAGWQCPEGYPDASEVTEFDDETGAPICGPLTPERARQVLAHVEVLKLEMAAIRIDADARGLEVDAIRLTTDTQQRKLQEATAYRAIRNGF